MKKLAIVFAVGVTTLFGGTAANADNSVKLTGASVGTSRSTDFSAHRRYRAYGPRYYRSYGYYAPRRAYYAPQAYYAPETYYAPRSYYAQPYYGGGGYGYGGPSISFGFGGW